MKSQVMKYKWCFRLDDGSKAYAWYTDQEIEEFRIKYPKVKFNDL